MGLKAGCCSAHLCLFGHSAARGKCTCLRTCTPAPVAFARNNIQAPAFPVNAVLYRAALATHIIAMRRERRAEPLIFANGI